MAGNEEGLSLSLELPGLSREDVDLKIEGRTLTVTATRKKTNDETVTSWVMRQRQQGNLDQMVRNLELPFEIETAHVKARMEHGVLHIDLPRREATKPRKITIEG